MTRLQVVYCVSRSDVAGIDLAKAARNGNLFHRRLPPFVFKAFAQLIESSGALEQSAQERL